MQVTTTDFKLNLDKYLKLVQTEDILITKNGKPVAKLINPNISSVDSISGALTGRVPGNLDRHSVREERLSKYTIADCCTHFLDVLMHKDKLLNPEKPSSYHPGSFHKIQKKSPERPISPGGFHPVYPHIYFSYLISRSTETISASVLFSTKARISSIILSA